MDPGNGYGEDARVKQGWSDRHDSFALAGTEPYKGIERHEFGVVGGWGAGERLLQSV
jgi:hypothetical protein